MTAKYDENHSRLPARIRAKITPAPPPVGIEGDCWLWTGALNSGAHSPAGYGVVRWDGRLLYVHRVTYELLVGPIPDGLETDHLCRVRVCCNPAHLEPVTHAENCRRGARAKLSAEDVEAIRRAPGTHREIGERYGVRNSTVCRIKSTDDERRQKKAARAELAVAVRERRAEGATFRQIAELYGIGPMTAHRLSRV